MICALVLAAGRSRRMGTQKLLLPFAGETVIGHVVSQVIAGSVDAVYVVVGGDGRAVADALREYPVRIVTNPEPDAEMLTSVRCGLRALPAGCRAALVVLGDQPGITTDLVNAVIDAYRTSGKGIIVPAHAGRRGHPLLLSAHYHREVLEEHDGVGLRGLLHSHADDVLEVPIPSPVALADMDCPEDYRRALASLSAEETRPTEPGDR